MLRRRTTGRRHTGGTAVRGNALGINVIGRSVAFERNIMRNNERDGATAPGSIQSWQYKPCRGTRRWGDYIGNPASNWGRSHTSPPASTVQEQVKVRSYPSFVVSCTTAIYQYLHHGLDGSLATSLDIYIARDASAVGWKQRTPRHFAKNSASARDQTI